MLKKACGIPTVVVVVCSGVQVRWRFGVKSQQQKKPTTKNTSACELKCVKREIEKHFFVLRNFSDDTLPVYRMQSIT